MVHVKLCFLVDCTASMEPWIQAAKDQVMKIVDATQGEFPDAEFETAFVGYRDYGDVERFIEIPFCEPAEMLRGIRNVHAEGGADIAEDVATGLHKACHLNWEGADVSTVVHIADAPPHGRTFHGASISDVHMGGDPCGLDPLDYIQAFSVRNIDYTFVKINDTTDKMLDAFMEVYDRADGFKVVDLRPQTTLTHLPPPLGAYTTPPRTMEDTTLFLSPSITRTITASISRHTASQDPVEV